MEKIISSSEFNELTRENKAIIVAKDVIAQIEAKKYIAKIGSYVYGISFENNERLEAFSEFKEKDIKENFEKIVNCHVCAIGSCLLSTTKFANKLKFQDIGGGVWDFSNKSFELLSEVFTPKQQLLIETCFEGYNNCGIVENFEEEYQKEEFEYSTEDTRFATHTEREIVLTYDEIIGCLRIKEKWINEENDEELLIAIMRNIIENEGIFVV